MFYLNYVLFREIIIILLQTKILGVGGVWSQVRNHPAHYLSGYVDIICISGVIDISLGNLDSSL